MKRKFQNTERINNASSKDQHSSQVNFYCHHGRTIQALVGAIFGPICGGLLYRKTKNIWAALVGEVFGVGILGALAAYPLMRAFYGLEKSHFYYFIPFYIPSAFVGGLMGIMVILSLKKANVLERMQRKLS